MGVLHDAALPHAHLLSWQTFERHVNMFKKGLERYRVADAYTSYAYYPDRHELHERFFTHWQALRELMDHGCRPHCDKGQLGVYFRAIASKQRP